MAYLALDLSLSTGFALWRDGMAKPMHATWRLGMDQLEVGRACRKLHEKLMDLHQVEPFDRIVMEEALSPEAVRGFTNRNTLYLLAGLAAHVESFGDAFGARVRSCHQSTWRKIFLGNGSGFKTKEFKRMSIARCREFGWNPATDNDADALGLLDYQLSLTNILPPWRADKLLVSEFGAAR